MSKYERSLNADGNRLSEQFSEPSEAEIHDLLDRLLPKLRKALRTPASSYKFFELLVSSLVSRNESGWEPSTLGSDYRVSACQLFFWS